MIVVGFSGGLGNQIFQYVFVKMLEKAGKDVMIDLSAYKYVKEHCGPEFFAVFRINKYSYLNTVLRKYYCREMFVQTFHRYFPWLTPWKIRHIIPFIVKNYKLAELKTDFVMNSVLEVMNIDNCIISGVFGNPECDLSIAEELKKELQFSVTHLDNFNLQYLKEIDNSNSISLHIRRGDFKESNQRNQSIVLPIQYYHDAICMIEKYIKDPKYFVFTDDKEWVKDNFTIKNTTYVNCNIGNNSYLDMFLMSKCKHNIIANSTFSWWGAWLNEHKDKIVISPKYWYDNCLAIICRDWNMLEY